MTSPSASAENQTEREEARWKLLAVMQGVIEMLLARTLEGTSRVLKEKCETRVSL